MTADTRRIVAFVIPAGYSFNLDGSTLYLAVASVFVAQAAGIHLLRQPFELDEILDCSLHVSVSVCSTILRNRWVRSFFG